MPAVVRARGRACGRAAYVWVYVRAYGRARMRVLLAARAEFYHWIDVFESCVKVAAATTLKKAKHQQSRGERTLWSYISLNHTVRIEVFK